MPSPAGTQHRPTGPSHAESQRPQKLPASKRFHLSATVTFTIVPVTGSPDTPDPVLLMTKLLVIVTLPTLKPPPPPYAVLARTSTLSSVTVGDPELLSHLPPGSQCSSAATS